MADWVYPQDPGTFNIDPGETDWDDAANKATAYLRKNAVDYVHAGCRVAADWSSETFDLSRGLFFATTDETVHAGTLDDRDDFDAVDYTEPRDQGVCYPAIIDNRSTIGFADGGETHVWVRVVSNEPNTCEVAVNDGNIDMSAPAVKVAILDHSAQEIAYPNDEPPLEGRSITGELTDDQLVESLLGPGLTVNNNNELEADVEDVSSEDPPTPGERVIAHPNDGIPTVDLVDDDHAERAVNVPGNGSLKLCVWGGYTVPTGDAPSGVEVRLLTSGGSLLASANTVYNANTDGIYTFNNSSGSPTLLLLRLVNNSGTDYTDDNNEDGLGATFGYVIE